MLFDDKLSDIIRTLENDGVLLLPSDSVWGLACSMYSKKGNTKIKSILNREKSDSLDVLVDSIEMLKKLVPNIHPRIDTLLHFHKKPLTIIYPNVSKLPSFLQTKDKRIPIRIVHDPYCNKIINLLGAPLVFAPAKLKGNPYPASFADIDLSILQRADFVSKHKQNNSDIQEPSVLIDYDPEGEINFLRT
ncbi:MAG: Sua5/YciO/YrdC/YwlC family protein [Saprospiraceae bacterium]|nr:Sua5/YciO/YrdC/YwlC family protein [Saprospiraceae bacterium]